MPPGKIRIKDIALLAGVSIGTVDRVIHDRGEVAEKTRERVKRILKETNYSPDVMAKVLKSGRGFHLVSLLPEASPNNSFWEKHPEGMKRAVDELAMFHVTLSQVSFDMFDEEDYQDKANSVFELNPDGVIIAPIFKSESQAFCLRLTESGIPFVFVDGLIENTDFLAYIGEDIFQSGRVAGQLMDIITPGERDILVVSIARNIQNVHHLNSRTQGFLSYFNGTCSNTGKKIMINIPEPSSASVSRSVGTILAENPSIASVFVSGSKSYLIASYLAQKGINDIHIIGYDLIEENIKYLRSGVIRFLIGQRPEEQSFKAVKKLFEFLSSKRIPEKREYLPIDIITSENVGSYSGT